MELNVQDLALKSEEGSIGRDEDCLLVAFSDCPALELLRVLDGRFSEPDPVADVRDNGPPWIDRTDDILHALTHYPT